MDLPPEFEGRVDEDDMRAMYPPGTMVFAKRYVDDDIDHLDTFGLDAQSVASPENPVTLPRELFDKLVMLAGYTSLWVVE